MVYRVVPYSDYICHHGVKGMHWGIRRYQNYDGTRITNGRTVYAGKGSGSSRGASRVHMIKGAGKGKIAGIPTSQLAAKASTGSDESKPNKTSMFDRTIKNGKGKENTSPAEEVAKGVRNASRDAKPLVDTAKKYDPNLREQKAEYAREAQQMSDKELRDRINRIKMEREYQSLKSSEVETGYDKAKEFLDVAGDVASIAVSLATLAAIVYKLRHEDFDPEAINLMEDLDK